MSLFTPKVGSVGGEERYSEAKNAKNATSRLGGGGGGGGGVVMQANTFKEERRVHLGRKGRRSSLHKKKEQGQ